jgi:hypothetical protein
LLKFITSELISFKFSSQKQIVSRSRLQLPLPRGRQCRRRPVVGAGLLLLMLLPVVVVVAVAAVGGGGDVVVG